MSTPRFWPISAMSSLKRFDKIRKNTPTGASLIKNVMIFITIFSISLTARSSDESGPLIRHPTTTADTRTARSSSLATAEATLLGTKDSKTCTTTSWGAIPPLSSMSACSSSLTAIVFASATVIIGRQTRSTRIVLTTMAIIVVPTYPVYHQLHGSSQATPNEFQTHTIWCSGPAFHHRPSWSSGFARLGSWRRRSRVALVHTMVSNNASHPSRFEEICRTHLSL